MNDLSLLPGDPVGFFGLAEGYDRRDLKRAYGQAIRVYKPETHPADFGRVREAYERLEKQLRYGKQQQKLAEAADAWSDSSATASVPSEPSATVRTPAGSASDRPAAKPANELSLRQLAVADPVAAKKRLQAMPRRTPPDYFLAAVLADSTAGQPTAKYLSHLIEGLSAFPSDPGLISLTGEYLRTEVPDKMLVKVVQYVAEKLRSPVFYMLTESLWLRLVDGLPFDQFAALLTQCERSIRQTETAYRTTFYLRLLRSAIWKAPASWTDAVMGELESQSAELNHTANSDLEFLEQLRQLLKKEAEQASTDPVRKNLLATIRLSCQKDDAATSARVLQVLNEIARNSKGVQNAFPMATASDDAVWVWLTYALIEQTQVYQDEPVELPAERIASQIRSLIQDLVPHIDRLNSAINTVEWRFKYFPLVGWMIVGVVSGLIPILGIGFGLLGTGPANAILVLVAILALLAGCFLSFFRWIYPKFLHDRLVSKQQSAINKIYVKRWRARLFRYAGASGDALQVQIARIDAVGNAMGHERLGDTINIFVRQDAGLCVYVALQSLVR
ncbi:hypothetical protein SAMN06265222_10981 [Neorhodopirellula lusitana]|uniref:J domain-containing protein n=1 Tax=Neorhodopirellula lusitana TaxID=445327 RepID=A0ABY1QB82_9BACT|nr:hypothetical protein [Neorhodopirellula lusitana]SMP65542.1 hypothetical protein SAMN06265222_10981 [Neorhodopirellula lusitana]